MITIKGTKAASEDTDPAAPYASQPEAKPGTVKKVVGLLAFVTLYLKMLLTGQAKAATNDGRETDPGEADRTPAVAIIPGGLADEEYAPRRQHMEGAETMPFQFNPGEDTIEIPTLRQVLSPVFRPPTSAPEQANANTIPGTSSSAPNGLGGPRHSFSEPDLRLVAPGDGQQETPAPAEPAPGTDDPGSDEEVEAPDPADPAPGTDDPGPDEEVEVIDDGDGSGADQDGDSDEDEDEDEGPETGENRAPRVTGPVILPDISGCAVLVIGLAELLRGADDPDGDPLVVEALTTSSGIIEQGNNGSWTFSAAGELGPVTISYRISDGELSVDQTMQFGVVSHQSLFGTPGDDILIGTMCADEIKAGAGHDLIDARDGNDLIFGEAGDDHIRAGTGNDVVIGGVGADVIFGGAGDDELFGNAGDDRLFGEAGNDLLSGGSGDDLLRGGSGDDHVSGGDGDDNMQGGADNDVLFGNAGNDHLDGGSGDDIVVGGSGDDKVAGGAGRDRLFGDAGDDILIGAAGDDALDGGAGNDVIHDGEGADIVIGGEGDDHVVAAADEADDRYQGDEGCDILDYSVATEPLAIDLVSGTAEGVEIGEDMFSGFERIIAGSGNDFIRFGDNSVSVKGGDGCNTFEFVAPAVERSSLAPTRREYAIEDFKVGDRISMSGWEIHAEAFDAFEDVFDRLFEDDADADLTPIRFQNKWSEMMNETLIEADLDGDDQYETMISLDGRHALFLVEAV